MPNAPTATRSSADGSGVTVTVKLVPVSSRGDVFAPKPELVGSIVIW